MAEHALALLLAGLRYLPERARARSWGQPAAQTYLEDPLRLVLHLIMSQPEYQLG